MEENAILTIAVLGAFNLGLLTIICWIRSVKIPAFFWLGWIFMPRITVAVIASMLYFKTNPLLCILTWIWALVGESAEKKQAQKQCS